MLGSAVLAALVLDCAAPMLTVAAMLSVDTLFRAEPLPAQRTPQDEARIAQKQELLVRFVTSCCVQMFVTSCCMQMLRRGWAVDTLFRAEPHPTQRTPADEARASLTDSTTAQFDRSKP